MKLSEAIMIGDSLKKCDPGQWLSKDGSCGCAFGGAILAAGIKDAYLREKLRLFPTNELPCIKKLWPWLTWSHLYEISGLYFCVAMDQATIEDVCAYVQSIEPREEMKRRAAKNVEEMEKVLVEV